MSTVDSRSDAGHGTPMVTRDRTTAGVILAGGRASRMGGRDKAFAAVDTVPDLRPGCGPLAGIEAAMLASRHPWVFVVACDMPGLDAGVIRWLLARPRAADAVVPRWEADVEPLHALYAVHTLPAVQGCLDGGRHALRDFL